MNVMHKYINDQTITLTTENIRCTNEPFQELQKPHNLFIYLFEKPA